MVALKTIIKKNILLIIGLILIPAIHTEAVCNKVFVINLNYNQGSITYKNKIIKCGFPPDYKIQPEEGYRLELMSPEDKVVYSIKFEVPLKAYTDEVNSYMLSGGLLILNQTDFALVLPYYENAKNIVIYNQNNEKILSINLTEEKPSMRKQSFIWVLLILIITIFIMLLLYRHKKKKYTKTTAETPLQRYPPFYPPNYPG